MTRVLVADAQPLSRASLVRLVERRVDLSLVAALDDGRGALDALRGERPDVAILAAPLCGVDAPQVVHAVCRDGLGTRMILIVESVCRDRAWAAVARGASGCLTRQTGVEELELAIEAVVRGRAYFCADVQTELAHDIRVRERDERPLITARERQVLHALAAGRGTAAIAASLHVAAATVKTHRANLYEKLGVSDRAAAVAEGMRRGLLE